MSLATAATGAHCLLSFILGVVHEEVYRQPSPTTGAGRLLGIRAVHRTELAERSRRWWRLFGASALEGIVAGFAIDPSGDHFWTRLSAAAAGLVTFALGFAASYAANSPRWNGRNKLKAAENTAKPEKRFAAI